MMYTNNVGQSVVLIGKGKNTHLALDDCQTACGRVWTNIVVRPEARVSCYRCLGNGKR